MEKNVKEVVMKEAGPAVLAGAVSYAIAYGLGGNDITVDTAIGEMSGSMALGMSTFAGHLSGQILSDYVLKNLQGSTYSNAESKIVPALSSGVASYLTVKLLIDGNAPIVENFAWGAVSSSAGTYLYELYGDYYNQQ